MNERLLLKYSTVQNGARYVFYDFSIDVFGGMQSPWVSGFAQGQVLSGLVYIHSKFNDDRSLAIANEIYKSYTQLRDKQSEDFWITEVDENGFLWIEEYPQKKDPQPKVLNGHIWGIYGLYNYNKLNPNNDELQLLLKAAITSVNYYVNKYRIPGSINRYSLYNFKSDYSPERTILQQFDLFSITGEQYFLQMSQTFQLDYDLYNSNREEITRTKKVSR